MLIFFRTLLCPYCQRSYKVTFSMHPVIIGRGMRKCSVCHKEFDDGSREWKNLSPFQRFHTWVPFWAKIWFGSLIALTLAQLWNDGFSLKNITSVVSFLGFISLPWLPFWFYRFYTIQKSLARTGLEQKK